MCHLEAGIGAELKWLEEITALSSGCQAGERHQWVIPCWEHRSHNPLLTAALCVPRVFIFTASLTPLRRSAVMAGKFAKLTCFSLLVGTEKIHQEQRSVTGALLAFKQQVFSHPSIWVHKTAARLKQLSFISEVVMWFRRKELFWRSSCGPSLGTCPQTVTQRRTVTVQLFLTWNLPLT